MPDTLSQQGCYLGLRCLCDCLPSAIWVPPPLMLRVSIGPVTHDKRDGVDKKEAIHRSVQNLRDRDVAS